MTIGTNTDETINVPFGDLRAILGAFTAHQMTTRTTVVSSTKEGELTKAQRAINTGFIQLPRDNGAWDTVRRGQCFLERSARRREETIGAGRAVSEENFLEIG